MTHDPLASLERRALDAGIPVRRLAEAAGIAPSTWTRWKSRKHSPNLSTLMAVEAALVRLQADAARAA